MPGRTDEGALPESAGGRWDCIRTRTAGADEVGCIVVALSRALQASAAASRDRVAYIGRCSCECPPGASPLPPRRSSSRAWVGCSAVAMSQTKLKSLSARVRSPVPANSYRGSWVDTFRNTVLTQLLAGFNQQGSSAGWTYIDYSAGPDKWSEPTDTRSNARDGPIDRRSYTTPLWCVSMDLVLTHPALSRLSLVNFLRVGVSAQGYQPQCSSSVGYQPGVRLWSRHERAASQG